MERDLRGQKSRPWALPLAQRGLLPMVLFHHPLDHWGAQSAAAGQTFASDAERCLPVGSPCRPRSARWSHKNEIGLAVGRLEPLRGRRRVTSEVSLLQDKHVKSFLSSSSHLVLTLTTGLFAISWAHPSAGLSPGMG